MEVKCIFKYILLDILIMYLNRDFHADVKNGAYCRNRTKKDLEMNTCKINTDWN